MFSKMEIDTKKQIQKKIKTDKKQFIGDLRLGSDVNDVFAVKFKGTLREYVKGWSFDFTVADKTGDMKVKYWGRKDRDSVKEIYQCFDVDDLVFITGKVSSFRDQLEIQMNEELHHTITKCDRTEYDLGDFLSKTEKDVEGLLDYLRRVIDSINDPHLNRLLHSLFDNSEFVKAFKESPAAITHHHNFLGGLLEHTVGVVKICESLCSFYTELDRDILLTAAILHDIGKIPKYKYTVSISMSDEGRFIGHIVLGDRIVWKIMGELPDFPDDYKMKLSHMILSHHGEYEWGSPKIPATAEACALHYADNCDSKVKEFLQVIKDQGGVDAAWIYHKGRNIYLK